MFKYGWVPDVPDGRDFLYGAIRPRLRITPSVDLKMACSPPSRTRGGWAAARRTRSPAFWNFWTTASTMPFAYLETLAADFWTVRK